VGTVEVIVMKIKREEGSAVVAGVIRAGVGPLAGDSLDEALGLAVGLRAIGFGEEVTEAELLAGGGEELGAIGGAAIGEDALDFDAVSGVAADGLVESREDAGSLFVGQESGEGEAGMIVDGDVEALDAGARIAHGAITGGPDARAREAAQLLDVEVEKVAGSVAFVAEDGRFWRLERAKAVEVMAAEDAREGGLGDWPHHHDLSIGTALTAQGEDLGFKFGRRLARLAPGSGGMILETLGEAGLTSASEPAADGLFRDAKSGGGSAQRAAELGMLKRHLRSPQRGQSGISVHVVRAGGRWVECSSTTILTDPFRADNVLKHDT
jgi:hypothetical protein